jgi:hypothetical protein
MTVVMAGKLVQYAVVSALAAQGAAEVAEVVATAPLCAGTTHIG